MQKAIEELKVDIKKHCKKSCRFYEACLSNMQMRIETENITTGDQLREFYNCINDRK